jgi:hypothetical protein
MEALRLWLRLLGKLDYISRGFRYAAKFQSPPEGMPKESPSRFRDFFNSRTTGRGIWKFNHYFDIYERHLSRFAGKPVHLVEVGVYSGGSLEMWRDYFGQHCRIYGVDIQKACEAYANEYTSIFIGDQSDPAFWTRFRHMVPTVDILIDDASHRPEHQIATLEAMLPHLRPGGVYICEDTHGLHNGFTAYAHGLTKSLNAMDSVSPFQAAISSIHFYPYMVVIEKAPARVTSLKAPKRGTEWAPFSTA